MISVKHHLWIIYGSYCAISMVTYTSMKNIFQKCRGIDVGMAVPKTTETRCRDGSVQARQVIKKTTQATPSLHLSFFLLEIVL